MTYCVCHIAAVVEKTQKRIETSLLLPLSFAISNVVQNWGKGVFELNVTQHKGVLRTNVTRDDRGWVAQKRQF